MNKKRFLGALGILCGVMMAMAINSKASLPCYRATISFGGAFSGTMWIGSTHQIITDTDEHDFGDGTVVTIYHNGGCVDQYNFRQPEFIVRYYVWDTAYGGYWRWVNSSYEYMMPNCNYNMATLHLNGTCSPPTVGGGWDINTTNCPCNGPLPVYN